MNPATGRDFNSMKPQRCADNDTLSAAGIMFAAVTSGSLPKRKK